MILGLSPVTLTTFMATHTIQIIAIVLANDLRLHLEAHLCLLERLLLHRHTLSNVVLRVCTSIALTKVNSRATHIIQEICGALKVSHVSTHHRGTTIILIFVSVDARLVLNRMTIAANFLVMIAAIVNVLSHTLQALNLIIHF
jgi:hypothetical protein